MSLVLAILLVQRRQRISMMRTSKAFFLIGLNLLSNNWPRAQAVNLDPAKLNTTKRHLAFRPAGFLSKSLKGRMFIISTERSPATKTKLNPAKRDLTFRPAGFLSKSLRRFLPKAEEGRLARSKGGTDVEGKSLKGKVFLISTEERRRQQRKKHNEYGDYKGNSISGELEDDPNGSIYISYEEEAFESGEDDEIETIITTPATTDLSCLGSFCIPGR